jgi:ketosteroid isomerase-like protein
MVLVQNEQAFAAAVAARGMRDGFLEYLADDGVLFVPGAVNGKEHYEASPQRPAVLTWVPIYAEIASGGDLGYCTGPWEWREDSTSDAGAWGQYVTIWKLQPDSTWKCVVDIGVAHEAHQSPPTLPAVRVLDLPDNHESVNLESARADLIRVDRGFSAASASEGLVAAYLSRITDDVRYLRMGEYVHQGVSAITTALRLIDGVWRWEPTYADVARNGDLGYTHGVSRLDVAGSSVQYSYMRIWRKDQNSRWNLALDIHIPLPPPQEEAP